MGRREQQQLRKQAVRSQALRQRFVSGRVTGVASGLDEIRSSDSRRARGAIDEAGDAGGCVGSKHIVRASQGRWQDQAKPRRARITERGRSEPSESDRSASPFSTDFLTLSAFLTVFESKREGSEQEKTMQMQPKPSPARLLVQRGRGPGRSSC
ncbi:hypothetical protein BJY59DRAFT_124635 [Rhodotorula toruloides]